LIDQTTWNSGIILLLTILGSLVWLSIHAVGNTWLLDKDCLSEFSIDQLSACHLNLLKGIGSQGLVNFFLCIGQQDTRIKRRVLTICFCNNPPSTSVSRILMNIFVFSVSKGVATSLGSLSQVIDMDMKLAFDVVTD
jgi:hypothetical protein